MGRALLHRNQLCLYALTIDGAAVAALYGCRTVRSVYLYLSGFDPRAASLSPGLLIIGAATENAIQTSAAQVDFLTGLEAYKYAWGARDRPLYHRRLIPARARLGPELRRQPTHTPQQAGLMAYQP